MLLHGDELGRTQGGNNNAYCQDNEISWIDWALADDEREPARRSPPASSRCAHAHPVFRRRRFFHGRPIRGRATAPTLPDIAWFTPTGEEMTEQDWDAGFGKCVAVFLNGEASPSPTPRGERVIDDSFLLLLNAHHEDIEFTLPGAEYGSGGRSCSTPRPAR